MSQDSGFATMFPQNTYSTSHNNDSFNTEGSLNHNTNSFNNHSFNTNTNITVVDDRSEILTWLSPLEPRLRHSDVRSNRVSNVQLASGDKGISKLEEP